MKRTCVQNVTFLAPLVFEKFDDGHTYTDRQTDIYRFYDIELAYFVMRVDSQGFGVPVSLFLFCSSPKIERDWAQNVNRIVKTEGVNFECHVRFEPEMTSSQNKMM